MNRLSVLISFFMVFGLSAEPLLAKEKLRVEPGRKVKIEYSLKSGKEHVDPGQKKHVEAFVFGEKELLPSFEENLLGMRQGEKKKFEVPPEEAFGLWNIENVRIFPRSELPKKKLKPGTVLTARHHAAPHALTGRVSKVVGDEVGVDFNHPLAGKTLEAELKVKEVV
jgi:FKBP-type peptidyl-prolyl cis-trans isomerase SlpA